MAVIALRTKWLLSEPGLALLTGAELSFHRAAGMLAGARMHLPAEEDSLAVVHLLAQEAYQSTHCPLRQGRYEPIRRAIAKNLGQKLGRGRPTPFEIGLAEIALDLYLNFSQPLTIPRLGLWRAARPDPKITSLRDDWGNGPELDAFTSWFARTGPGQPGQLPAIYRAAVAYLYIASWDQNALTAERVAVAAAQLAMSQTLGCPTLCSLATILQQKRSEVRDMIEEIKFGKDLKVWVSYFSTLVSAAQAKSLSIVEARLAKTALRAVLQGPLNNRQDAAMAWLFEDDYHRVAAGIDAKRYISITGASRITAFRDLQKLVSLGALRKTGISGGTRYWANIE